MDIWDENFKCEMTSWLAYIKRVHDINNSCIDVRFDNLPSQSASSY